jgi:hypothetical protein
VGFNAVFKLTHYRRLRSRRMSGLEIEQAPAGAEWANFLAL